MKATYDFVIEAVRYANGHVEWVRGYPKLWIHYNDVVLVSRDQLIHMLQQGKKVAVGKRIPYMGNSFEILGEVFLTYREGKPWLAWEQNPEGPRELDGVPQL